MNKYKSGDIRFSELVNSVVLPPFQRRLVWSKKQKEDFIETLSNGYPFGSILIYKYKDDPSQTKYTLIDGLQRYSTIKEFQLHPERYMNFDNIVESLFDLIASDHISDITLSVEKRIKSIINNKLTEVISSRTQYQDSWNWALVDSLKEDGLSGYYDPRFVREIADLQTKAMKQIDQHIDTKNIVIPFIEFLGDEDELATVFENLNRGGKKLSKYQVFAAQWSNNEITLGNTAHNLDILDKVINRYKKLIKDRDIDIENFDADAMKKSKKINLAELCGALGELILESVPVFWDKSAFNNEDKANAIGYSTVAITLGISNKKLNSISQHSELFNNPLFLESYIEKITKEYQTINNYFEKYLKLPGVSSNKKFESKTAADFQILSFFASLWTVKYTFNNTKNDFDILPKYKKTYVAILNNFIYYFLEDVASKQWSGTGDSKLDKIYIDRNNRYIRNIPRSVLEDSLNKWWEDRSSLPSINFDPVSKLILTVQTSFFDKQYNASSYDLEHIISKSSLNKIYTQDDIPAGSLGNMMFLDSSYNRAKQDINLYNVLQEGHSLDTDYLANTLYPSEPDLDEVTIGLNKNRKDSTKAKEVIRNRGKYIINNLISNLYS